MEERTVRLVMVVGVAFNLERYVQGGAAFLFVLLFGVVLIKVWTLGRGALSFSLIYYVLRLLLPPVVHGPIQEARGRPRTLHH